jgi:hypothetical protein
MIGSPIRRAKGAGSGRMRTTGVPFSGARRKPVKNVGRLDHKHFDPVTGRRRSKGASS